MKESSTRLQNPLHLWFARIAGFSIVLITIGINIYLLPEEIDRIKRQGVVQDVYHGIDEDGVAIVGFVSAEAEQKGVFVGDKILNPEDDTIGEIGSPVTLQVQTGDNSPREVTFTRKLSSPVAYSGILLGVPSETSGNLAMILSFLPIMIGSVAALLICWLRSDDWMALLTGMSLAGSFMYHSPEFFIVIFRSLVTPLLFFWFILFPNGRFSPRWSWLLVLLTIPHNLFYLFLSLGILEWNPGVISLEQTFTILSSIALFLMLGVIIYRYRRIFSPIERQQSKWIFAAMIIGLPLISVSNLFYISYWYSSQIEKSYMAYFINSVVGFIAFTLFVTGIIFSVFRYRLYDVDIVINRAIVYSILTGILGVSGYALSAAFDYILQQSLGDQTGLLAIAITSLPIAALFNPVRQRIQKVVDRYFRQYEIDFEKTFVEFTAELRAFFSLDELAKLLSSHAVEQLEVSYASVFISDTNGNLRHLSTNSMDESVSVPVIEEKSLKKIKDGDLAIPDGDTAHSLIISLAIPRARKPNFIGALVLGPRLNGLGYPTPMLKGLKKLGEDVGKAFYIAQLKHRK